MKAVAILLVALSSSLLLDAGAPPARGGSRGTPARAANRHSARRGFHSTGSGMKSRKPPSSPRSKTSFSPHHTFTHHSSVSSRNSHGKVQRSEDARDSFQRSHPCPSSGKKTGACTGYVVDHVVPLKRGGADSPSNMQWQTVEAARTKDKVE